MAAGKGSRRVWSPLALGRAIFALAAAVIAAHLLSCAPSLSLGVTGGGQQDIASARLAIEAGEVPDPEAISVEGLLSEHSIPMDAPADPELLYPTIGTAWNLDFDAFTPLVTLQIGFGTTLNLDEFERPDLNLAIVIDRSGSMGRKIEQRTDATKLDAVKIAIDRLLPHLRAEDRVSIVAFNSRSVLALDGVSGTNYAAIKDALDSIQPEGDTNLVAGLARGYQAILDHTGGGRNDRVLLFTDAQIDFHRQDWTRAFINEMAEYAEREIGTTVFGVGVHFGDDLAYDISQVRGGNYFFLSSYERIVSVFDDEFDLLVTPVAYDVNLSVAIPPAFDPTGVYGFSEPDPLTHNLDLTIPTLFLSRRQGGGVAFVRLRAGALADFSQEMHVATVTLEYTTPEGVTVPAGTLSASLPAGLDESAGERYFSSPGVQRGVLLLNTALVLHDACEDVWPNGYYGGSWGYYYYYDAYSARQRLTEFLPYFDELAEGLVDRTEESSRALSEERAMLAKLLANLEGY